MDEGAWGGVGPKGEEEHKFYFFEDFKRVGGVSRVQSLAIAGVVSRHGVGKVCLRARRV